jgi:hypothetical protein
MIHASRTAGLTAVYAPAMLALMLLFIILSAVAPVLLAETHQEVIYDAEPATSRA